MSLRIVCRGLVAAAGCLWPLIAPAGEAQLELTSSATGFAAIAIFALAYLVVMAEEFTGLRKCKPVLLAAGLIWALIGIEAAKLGLQSVAAEAVQVTIEEYSELLLFLLVAMTYVNAMTDRNVFGALRTRLARSGATYRQLFWATGVLSFFLSAAIDNLTTALVMSGVVIALGEDRRFIPLACINIVVAANAGGAWSAFGDITTLMVWQAGHLDFFEFFQLLPASTVNYLVPATLMHFAVPPGRPSPGGSPEAGALAPGGRGVMLMFALTLLSAVSFQNFLGMPPVVGMMTGLAYLQLYGFYLKRRGVTHSDGYAVPQLGDVPAFDVFRYTARAEWDTLLFFYGVILCVGGLGTMGYLTLASEASYGGLGATTSNVLVGVASAIIDNIPIMAAVLGMQPVMPDGQWLLITLTAGVGGSMLSIGSAAGVALMGQARGEYTFFRHLRWTPAIALGYAASIWLHLVLNRELF